MTNKLYHAASLEDIAKMFDGRAQSARNCAQRQATVAYKNEFIAMSYVWGSAAEILRQTELDVHQPINEAYSFIDEASNITPEMLIGSYVTVLNNSCHAEGHPAQADVDKIMKDG